MTVLSHSSREHVLPITQHRLTRLIDTSPTFARAELTTLRLCTEENGPNIQYYVLIKLRNKTGMEIWLRLEQMRKRVQKSIPSIPSPRFSSTDRISRIVRPILLGDFDVTHLSFASRLAFQL